MSDVLPNAKDKSLLTCNNVKFTNTVTKEDLIIDGGIIHIFMFCSIISLLSRYSNTTV